MPIICWGNLAKSATETTTIDSEISDYIETHDENPNAHMGADYSLGAHRLAVELDHASGSVGFHHLVMDSITGMGFFESLDGWATHGSLSVGVFGIMVRPSTSDDNDEAYLWPGKLIGSSLSMDPTKNPFFQTTVILGSDTSQLVYFGLGVFGLDDSWDGIGFKVVNANLYACWSIGGTIHTHAISSVTVNVLHCYRVNVDSALNKIYFYVDGVLEYTATTYFPTALNTHLFHWYIKQTSASLRFLYCADWLFQEDR
jgi:hypothetical protein